MPLATAVNYNLTTPIDLNWIAGFTSGEGCFHVNLRKQTDTKLGYAAQLVFTIGQLTRDKILLTWIAKTLNCGNVTEQILPPTTTSSKIRSDGDFRVTKFYDILNLIIPLFKAHPIQGLKQLDFLDFCEAADIMANKQHLTLEGLAKIKTIKDRTAFGRKR